MDSSRVPLVAELVIHVHNVKGALVVNDIIRSLLNKLEGVLVLKLEPTVVLGELTLPIGFILLHKAFFDACRKSHRVLTVVNALQQNSLKLSEDSLLGQLEKQGAIARAHVKKAQRSQRSRCSTVLVQNVLNSLLLNILSEPDLAIVTMLLKVFKLHLESRIPVLFACQLRLFTLGVSV